MTRGACALSPRCTESATQCPVGRMRTDASSCSFSAQTHAHPSADPRCGPDDPRAWKGVNRGFMHVRVYGARNLTPRIFRPPLLSSLQSCPLLGLLCPRDWQTLILCKPWALSVKVSRDYRVIGKSRNGLLTTHEVLTSCACPAALVLVPVQSISFYIHKVLNNS
jgi:hypothetical protein